MRQGQRSIVAGGILGIVLLAGVGAAIAAIIGAHPRPIQRRQRRRRPDPRRHRHRPGRVALLLMTLAGLELYSIGLDAF